MKRAEKATEKTSADATFWVLFLTNLFVHHSRRGSNRGLSTPSFVTSTIVLGIKPLISSFSDTRRFVDIFRGITQWQNSKKHQNQEMTRKKTSECKTGANATSNQASAALNPKMTSLQLLSSVMWTKADLVPQDCNLAKFFMQSFNPSRPSLYWSCGLIACATRDQCQLQLSCNKSTATYKLQ